jgi:hypothetical protein
MNQYFQIITGKITELEVIDTNLSHFSNGSFASLPLLGQLALGNSAEAASQVGMASGQQEADKIFATLGYPKPKTVNMEQEYMEMFFNNKSMNEPDFYIDVNTDEFKRKDPPGVKWVVFYRESPPIPDYITVIHTEKTNNNKRKK